MTGISSLFGSLKKTQAILEELLSTTQRELSAILTQLNHLHNLTTHLQETWEERLVTEESMTLDTTALKGELTAENQERNKLASTNTAQQQLLVEAKAEREKLQQELTKTEKQLEVFEDDIRNTNRALQEVEKSMVKVDEKLNIFDKEAADQLQSLEKQVSEARHDAELQNSKYKALRYLLQQGIITMPEAKVAIELQGKETTTLDHLQKTTFIGRFKVREVLEQMAERRIVKYEKDTDQVKVLKPIDL